MPGPRFQLLFRCPGYCWWWVPAWVPVKVPESTLGRGRHHQHHCCHRDRTSSGNCLSHGRHTGPRTSPGWPTTDNLSLNPHIHRSRLRLSPGLAQGSVPGLVPESEPGRERCHRDRTRSDKFLPCKRPTRPHSGPRWPSTYNVNSRLRRSDSDSLFSSPGTSCSHHLAGAQVRATPPTSS